MKIGFYILFIAFSFINVLSANENSYYLILKNNEVNVRYGPGFDYPIKYVYKKKNLPVKILDKKENFKKIINKYDYIIDGSDNFKTKFLLNDFCLKYKKFLVSGAISKFDGHIFNFNFKNKKLPCLRCFFQEAEPSDDQFNCETEGILGTVAGIVGTIQANEILKKILSIGKSLNGYILILNLLDLNFRKVKINKNKTCICNK